MYFYCCLILVEGPGRIGGLCLERWRQQQQRKRRRRQEPEAMRMLRRCNSKKDLVLEEGEGAGGGVAEGIWTGTIFSPDMKVEGSWVGRFSASVLFGVRGAGIVEFVASVLFTTGSGAVEGSSLRSSVGLGRSGLAWGTRAGAFIS
jgi:hypothetical protein